MQPTTAYIGMDMSSATVDVVVYYEHEPHPRGRRRVATTTAGMAEAARWVAQVAALLRTHVAQYPHLAQDMTAIDAEHGFGYLIAVRLACLLRLHHCAQARLVPARLHRSPWPSHDQTMGGCARGAWQGSETGRLRRHAQNGSHGLWYP